MENHKLDTDEHVRFYEQEFYVLSNFSAFKIHWKNKIFSTSEEVYHWEKFPQSPLHQFQIEIAHSAHEAFKYAEKNKQSARRDWADVRVSIMKKILFSKAAQHEYVRRKLLETGNRLLIEDSWRDDFWGWGPKEDGKNMLGKIWMEIRNELRDNNKTIKDWPEANGGGRFNGPV